MPAANPLRSYDSSGGDWLCENGADGFGLFPYGGNYGLADSYYTGSGNVWENNVWDDNSQPVCADGSAGCGTGPPPTPAEANWAAPTGAEAGVPVSLDGSASTGEAPITCKWTIETSAGSVLATKTGCKVTYTFAKAGTQYVKLTVTGANGQSDSNRQSFSVAAATSPPPPTPAEANWAAPTGAEAGVAVTLDGSASTGEAPITCKWTIETSAGSVLDTKTGCKVTYTFAKAGTQYVKLTVTGANGQSDSNRQSFSVAAATSPPPLPSTPPTSPSPLAVTADVPDHAFWSAPSQPRTGERFTLSGNASQGIPPLTCVWTVKGMHRSGAAGRKWGCTINLRFRHPGERYIRLTVHDGSGSSASLARTIHVLESPARKGSTKQTGRRRSAQTHKRTAA